MWSLTVVSKSGGMGGRIAPAPQGQGQEKILKDIKDCKDCKDKMRQPQIFFLVLAVLAVLYVLAPGFLARGRPTTPRTRSWRARACPCRCFGASGRAASF